MENKSTNGIFLLLAALILSGVFLFVGQKFIQSTKENQQTSQGITNTISVAGEGKTSVTPDELVISATVSELGKTTKEAQTMANDKITQVNAILKAANVPADDSKTTNVSVYPEYDYTNGQQVLKGYRSQQTLNIEVKGNDFAVRGGDIIDKVSAIGGVNIDNTYFNLKDQNAAMLIARQKAFDDAQIKAQQLAKVGGVTLGKPIMITDNAIQYTPIPYYRNAMESKGAIAADVATSVAPLSPGQSDVSVNINVVFEIK